MKLYGIFDTVGEDFLGFFQAKNDLVAMRMNARIPEDLPYDPKEISIICVCDDVDTLKRGAFVSSLDRCAEKFNVLSEKDGVKDE